LSDRNARIERQQHRSRINQRAREVEVVDFYNVLTGPELFETTEEHLPEHRERLYPPTVTLSMFLMQALNEDGSCQKAVNGWAARRTAEGLSPRSIDTGAYCKARQRLSVEMVTALTRKTGYLLNAGAQACWRWRGRVVKLVDGTGISMPDTAENQRSYPQPSSQARGVGFPLARLVGVLCLSTGAVLDAAMGPYSGKGNSELGLLRSLAGAFSPGDVMLVDSFYCNYFLIATLQGAGVDALFEQNSARVTDFRRGEALGRRDHLVRWLKPSSPPQWMTREQYNTFPDELTVRETKVDGRVLVTTMISHRKVRKSELNRLYGRRWNVELDIKNIKTTLGMEILRCRTPVMAEKEMWAHLLAYNLIRLLMAQAARSAGVHPRELSFKHTVQIWIEWTSQHLTGHIEPHHTTLFRLIAQLRVGHRRGRIEPRARKRRPKSYQWLKVPRATARRQVRLHGYLPNVSA
jgi:hypothetical protein